MNCVHNVSMRDRLQSIDLNLLLTLSVLLEEHSVSRCAERIGRSQSAVSHSLNRLRRIFDDPLLVRRGHSMVPTPRAEALRGPLLGVIRDAEDLFLPQDFEPARIARRYRLLAVSLAQFVLVPPLLRALRSTAPEAALEVHDLPAEPLADLLGIGDFDVAVCYVDDLDLPANLRMEPLFEDRHVCLMRKDLEVDDPVSWSEFAAHEHIVNQPRVAGYRFTSSLDRILERRGLRRVRRATLSQITLLPTLLLESDAIAVVSAREAEYFAKHYPLKTARPPFPPTRIVESMVWDDRRSADRELRWFLDQLRTAASGRTQSA